MIIARRERVRVARRIGYLPIRTPELDALIVVYGGILGDASPVSVVDCLRTLLQKPHRFEHIMINKLNTNASSFATFRASRGVVLEPPEPHWVMDLADTWEETISRHSRKHRWKLRSIEKEVFPAEGSAQVQIFEHSQEAREFVELATDVAKDSYQPGVGGGPPDPMVWQALLKSEALSNRVRCYMLISDGQGISYQAGAVYDGVYYCGGKAYRSEMASQRIGTALFIRIVKDLCQLGVSVIDFGFGDAEYKRIYGTRNWQESTVRIYGNSVKARLTYAIDLAVTATNATLKRTINPDTLAKIKKRWRQWKTPRKK